MHLYMTSACAPLLARTLCLPALFALLLLFYGPYTRWTHAGAPQTRAGLNFNMMAISALTAPFVTVITGVCVCAVIVCAHYSISRSASSSLLSRIV
jgi:hypothetical protein